MINVSLISNKTLYAIGVEKFLSTRNDFAPLQLYTNVMEVIRHEASKSNELFLIDVPSLGSTIKDLSKLRETYPDCKMIGICNHRKKDLAVEALDLGVAGIISEKFEEREFFHACDRVSSGDNFIQQCILSEVVSRMRIQNKARDEAKGLRLTQRELQVTKYLTEGLSNKIIADNLSLSESTIKHYISTVKEKFGVTSRVEIALKASYLEI